MQSIAQGNEQSSCQHFNIWYVQYYERSNAHHKCRVWVVGTCRARTQYIQTVKMAWLVDLLNPPSLLSNLSAQDCTNLSHEPRHRGAHRKMVRLLLTRISQERHFSRFYKHHHRIPHNNLCQKMQHSEMGVFENYITITVVNVLHIYGIPSSLSLA